MDTQNMTPAQVRALIRSGEITVPTSGMCPGYAQANLVVLPKDLAYDFLLFCLLYTSPSPRDGLLSRMPSSA